MHISDVANDLPPEVLDFISRHIISVEQLEILLLLHEHKERDWTVRDINERLRSQEASINKWLEVLISMKLVTAAENRFRFSGATPETIRQTTALADAYHERRIKVIEVIFSKPNQTLRSFVQAFELRKRP
jgi:hypothetical protein